MKWIGLSGGMGCGKSTALKAFKELGCAVSSADEIVSKLYENKKHLYNIIDLLSIDSSYKTTDLASIKSIISNKVFNNKPQLQKLESYLHPLVREKSEEIKNSHLSMGYEFSIYEVPLLFEKKMQSLFFKTICIGASHEVQLERVKKRNPNWSIKEIEARLNSQMSLKEKKQLCDFYIDNSKDFENLKSECLKVLNKLRD